MRKRELPNQSRSRGKVVERKRSLPHESGDRQARERVTNPSMQGKRGKATTVTEHMTGVVAKENKRHEREAQAADKKQRAELRKMFDA
ncbi:MAG: hypothetical protein HN396_10845 [Gemmatimonadales bacterium]|jgi:hypothetical protein|nr:hypothetical protein [Gemmatimonadales bacterium]